MTTSLANAHDPAPARRELLIGLSALWLLVFPSAGWIFQALPAWGLSAPGCLLKSWTGFPCFGCGTGRSAVAFVGGDPWNAWLYSPLSLFLWALALAVLAAAVLIPQPVWDRVVTRFRVRILGAGLVLLLLLNWCWVAGRET